MIVCSLAYVGFGQLACLASSTAIQLYGAEHAGRYVGLHYSVYAVGGIFAPPFAG